MNMVTTRPSLTFSEARRLDERRSRRIDAFLQIAIFVLSFAAIWMLNVPGPWVRWAPVVGLLSQPFWLAATWRASQPGMFLLAVAYCVPWALGIKTQFL